MVREDPGHNPCYGMVLGTGMSLGPAQPCAGGDETSRNPSGMAKRPVCSSVDRRDKPESQWDAKASCVFKCGQTRQAGIPVGCQSVMCVQVWTDRRRRSMVRDDPGHSPCFP